MSLLAYSSVGFVCLALFFSAYGCVIFEEKTQLCKSKPVIFAGCLMWLLIAIYEKFHGLESHTDYALSHLMNEIFQLFFILLTVMTFINSLKSLGVFKALTNYLVKKRISYRNLFWITGVLTFFLSAIADNLTSALLMATVISSTGKGNSKFTVPALVNVIVAANAGGAWSPIGDITSLMVWSSGKLQAFEFLRLFVPSFVSFVIPALCMSFFIPKTFPPASTDSTQMKKGAKSVIALGVFTVFLTLISQQVLNLPPFLGMMFGLGCLMMFSYFLNSKVSSTTAQREKHLDIFKKIKAVEFDTLLFFFGILIAVGALQYLGFLDIANNTLYGNFGFTATNIFIGILSSIVDNIPVMYAVIKMDPAMDIQQWLLITLTAGIGGSLLSVGSAAGVAVMSVDKENYTFISHLKWTPFIALGFIAGVATLIYL
jgi:Na+/H+ antiporter NhaD/arsenite permease-like protein